LNAFDYLDQVVSPSLEEAQNEPLSMRRVLTLVALVDAFAARVFQHRSANGPAVDFPNDMNNHDDTGHRELLSRRSESFRLFRDLAKSQKHASLTQGSPKVTDANQTNVQSLGFGQGGFGEGPFGGGPQIVVTANDGTMRNVISLCKKALDLLNSELKR
jgi:hypothetical protein